jgi:hypothetical protein
VPGRAVAGGISVIDDTQKTYERKILAGNELGEKGRLAFMLYRSDTLECKRWKIEWLRRSCSFVIYWPNGKTM